MVIDMNDAQLHTVAHLRVFIEGTPEVQFQPIHHGCPGFPKNPSRSPRYGQPRRDLSENLWRNSPSLFEL